MRRTLRAGRQAARQGARHFCGQKPTEQAVANAEAYITENVKQKEWTSFLVGNFLPKAIRPPFYTVMWLNHELAKIPESTREASLGAGKVEFWRDTINRIYAGEEPSPEPISISLTHACSAHPLTKLYLSRMAEARLYEVYHREVRTMEELMRLAEKTRGSTIMLTLELLRVELTREVEELAMEAGRAVGICDYIKRVPANMRSYRLYLPEEITRKHNVTIRTLWDRTHGRPKEEYRSPKLDCSTWCWRSPPTPASACSGPRS